MADNDTVQARIISSVFSRKNAAGQLAETYVSHIKIWEDADAATRKPRYILLSQTSAGTGYIHKSKLNTNGTFSVGKTWNLPELRGIQVLNPVEFNITLSRTYRWTTENEVDQVHFIDAMIKLYRSISNNAPLRLDGVNESLPYSQSANQSGGRSSASIPQYEGGRNSASIPPANQYEGGRSSASIPPANQYEGGRSSASIPLSANVQNGSGAPRLRTASQIADQDRGSSFHSVKGRSTMSERAPSPAPPAPQVARQRSGDDAPETLVPRMAQPPRSRSRARQAAATPPSGPGPTPSQPSESPSFSNARTNSDRTEYTQRAEPSSNHLAPESRAPSRTGTASPAPSTRPVKPTARTGQDAATPRRDPNARISFYDPGNQAALDRLIVINAGEEEEGEDETAQASMTNVEEMLEGYDWASDDIISKKSGSGAADLIEARLTDELMALEKANIHSFLESDDRVTVVLRYIDEALAQLDTMDTQVSTYKIHLNAVGDDISFIQSQNRGLQVQTQNQKALLSELENVLKTVHVDQDSLLVLTQERTLEKTASIMRLQDAAANLYKALQAGRDTDMAATMERLEEYRTHNNQFCKRLFDYLSIMFTAQSNEVLAKQPDGIKKGPQSRSEFVSHRELEDHLGRYSGLILYLKEMDESIYAKLCGTYFSAASELHGKQVKALLANYLATVKRAPDEEGDSTGAPSKNPSGMRRAGTIIRSPMESRRDKEKRGADGDLTASEALSLILDQLAPHLHQEDEFIQDLLQINDSAITFADFMGLDNYFRRQAARSAGLSPPTMKLVRGAMDLIFGFLPAEMKTWLDSALEKDNMQIIGLLVSLERFLIEAEERGNIFLHNLLEKQHMRLKGLFERHVSQQIKNIEQTKVTSKKRGGVAPFVLSFPAYLDRVESQLIGADVLDIRAGVDTAYDRIVQTMFESLKHMAKVEGEGEDKGQLNYHVVLIENMHYFVAEVGRQEIGSVRSFLRSAEGIYDESLSAYIKIVLRRPFSKIIDYFEGLERQLKTTAPSEISSSSGYGKSALKKVLKEYNSKDVRKHVEALFKRVEKHFTEASETATNQGAGAIASGTVMNGVWKACETELLRITELFGKRVSQCYADSGLTLEYTQTDVEFAFRRQLS